MKKLLSLFIISLMIALPCFAARWTRTSAYVYVDESSITRYNNGSVFYWKRIDKDKQNVYQIQFFENFESPEVKKVKSIVYGTRMNCKNHIITYNDIYLYDYNGKMIRHAKYDNKNKKYNPQVSTTLMHDIETPLVCEGKKTGFSNLKEALFGSKD